MRIISIIIILALFGATGYLFYQNLQFKNAITQNQTKIMILEGKSEIFEAQRKEIRVLKEESENLAVGIQEIKKENLLKEEDQEEQKEEESISKKSEEKKEIEDSSKEEKNSEPEKTKVFIPEYNETTQKVKFSEIEVEKNDNEIAEVYKELFRKNGNEKDIWNGYTFTTITVKDKIATVFLKGSWNPDEETSSDSFKKLIRSAAFKNLDIDNLVVRENSSVFNWCVDEDQSDEESTCSDEPKYWIESK